MVMCKNIARSATVRPKTKATTDAQRVRRLIKENRRLTKRASDAERRLRDVEEKVEIAESELEIEKMLRGKEVEGLEGIMDRMLADFGEKVKAAREECRQHERNVVKYMERKFADVLGYEREKRDCYQEKAAEMERKLSEIAASQDQPTTSAPRAPDAPTPMKIPQCQICRFEFNNRPDRTPRVLLCGHTLCEECAEKIADAEYIRCPFDRIKTGFRADRIAGLPKNYMIIEMMDPNYEG